MGINGEAPRRTSLAPLASFGFILTFTSLEAEGFFHFQGNAGIIFVMRWNIRPVICGVERCYQQFLGIGTLAQRTRFQSGATIGFTDSRQGSAGEGWPRAKLEIPTSIFPQNCFFVSMIDIGSDRKA